MVFVLITWKQNAWATQKPRESKWKDRKQPLQLIVQTPYLIKFYLDFKT